ncbi:unnamed protein product [Kluyveromyces dobzhanskii CBS 2104]|uniref:WGS project CCBQ000000000 data, contig 00272 n=1 Tax=Kluyveromyces dobzhanskii CBS 2104 TaxID=1427455 RepID=A0A0A8L8F0_9SACH|nr:unnamed protein product [Kluyveromyces dobzhanskii CBS 2104]
MSGDASETGSDSNHEANVETTPQVNELLQREEVKKVLSSDIAINALLSRLKGSLLTCEEYTKFMRKKYLYEEEHALEMAKTTKHFFQETGTSGLSRSIHQLLEYDNKLSQVKVSYVRALQKIYDEVTALLLTVTKTRKAVKDKSRRLEKDVSDAIHAAEKAKSRYISLCQDWEKLRLTDPTKTKLTLRGSKTTKEQEEDLQRKIDSADLEYKQKVDHSTSLRNTFLARERPQIVSELRDLILEIDTAMSIQLQKYTIWTENMILNCGVSVNPVDGNSKSMRSSATSMNNELDLYNFLNKYNSSKSGSMINKNLIPVEYKKHPSMARTYTSSALQGSNNYGKISNPSNFVVNSSKNSLPKRVISTQHESPFSNSSATAALTSTVSPPGAAYPPISTSSGQSHDSTNSNSMTSASSRPLKSMVDIEPPSESNQKDFGTLDPRPTNRQTSVAPSIATGDTMNRPSSTVQTIGSLPPGTTKDFKTFGVPLEILLDYDQDLVPAIVRQCIYVVDKYGLDLEGIYRKSANVLDVSRLKSEIDKDPSNIFMILPPKNYTDSDIYLVGSLLKTFFANLPDTLLPRDMTEEIKTCLSIEDPTTQKNYMHGIIYKLPDGQYWTIRAIIFHLKRVLEHEANNRMGLKALSIIWGPTIISPNNEDLNDVNYQISAMELLFDVADQAFEPE